MKKTITITDPRQVKVGDKAYFKDCDFGFAVLCVDSESKYWTLMVNNPLNGHKFWAMSSQFDHATREVEDPEWPDPHDFKLHVYLGADGRRYIYNPINERDTSPWVSEGTCVWYPSEDMEAYCPDALPLTKLRLVPAKDDDNEQ